MLLTESQVAQIFRETGVRLSVRTLTVLGRLVRVVNRHGVHYLKSDVDAIIAESKPAPAVHPAVARVQSMVSEWQALRSELAEIERREHPDITDHRGRVWTWWKKDLYTHCGMAKPADMVRDTAGGLPTQAALDNQNYDLCEICIDGRERHITPCKPEWKCSHAVCQRIHRESLAVA